MARFFHIPMPLLSDEQRQVFDVLERNAPRLLSDAASMFEVGSYGTATSLAILSIEETGKSWMLAFYYNVEDRDIARNIRKQLRSHSFKQLQSIMMLGGFAFHRAARDIVSKSSHPVTAEGLLVTHAAIRSNPERFPELQEASKVVEHALASLAGEWMREAGLMQLAERIRSKSVDEDKQNGFYVDFDVESSKVVSDPALATAEQAREYIDLARSALDCF